LPTSQPTGQPSKQPTSKPSHCPSSQPSSLPSTEPTSRPTRQPTAQPTVQPSRQPSLQPTSHPTMQPTLRPSAQPSRQPTTQPTPLTPNLLVNGNAESGALTGWQQCTGTQGLANSPCSNGYSGCSYGGWVPQGGSCKHGGSYGFAIHCSGASLQQTLTNLILGATYEIFIWIQCMSIVTVARNIYVGVDNTALISLTTSASTLSYQRYSAFFRASSTSHTFFVNGNGDNNFCTCFPTFFDFSF
jgi:hypothetical protein